MLAIYALPILLIAGLHVGVAVAGTAALFAAVWWFTQQHRDKSEVAPEDDTSLPLRREQDVTFANGKKGITLAFGSGKRR